MKTVSLLFAVLMAACVPAFSAEAPAATNPYAMSIAPAETFDAGVLSVQRFGSGGRPLILIPGLSSGAWAWQDMVRSLSGKHAVYVVTLPGFDGRAPFDGNVMDAARTSLRELITSRKLDKPVLIGHSLGGTLSFAFAEDAPQLVGGLVAVDGLPVFPGTENMAPEMRAQAAAQFRIRMAAVDKSAFAAQQKQIMQTGGVLDMNKGEALGQLSAKSDPASVGRAAADDIALDLRPGLSKITAPVLLVSPYYEPDAVQVGMTEASKTAYYKSLVNGVPNIEVVSIAPARHFVMFDQPQKLADTINRFLSKL
jgi:pimeloyl-ACP methyl ester carboxylesterase